MYTDAKCGVFQPGRMIRSASRRTGMFRSFSLSRLLLNLCRFLGRRRKIGRTFFGFLVQTLCALCYHFGEDCTTSQASYLQIIFSCLRNHFSFFRTHQTPSLPRSREEIRIRCTRTMPWLSFTMQYAAIFTFRCSLDIKPWCARLFPQFPFVEENVSSIKHWPLGAFRHR